MEIKKGSDLILILRLEDIKGKPLRVKDTAHIKVYVWTANKNNYLVFNKRDILTEGNVDRIAIPDYYMNTLETGVICYTYDYAVWDSAFKHTDCMYNKVKEVVTDLLWENSNFNEIPANPINYQTLEYIKDLIEAERLDRERADKHLEHFVKCEYTDKLNEEVKRSTDVDIEMLNRINSNKELTDGAIKLVSDKLDAEVKRSNEVDIAMHKLIKESKEGAVNDAKDLVSGLETKVEATNTEILNKIDENDRRAKQAEQNITSSLNSLNDAVISMVNEANGNVDKEKSRATLAENKLANDIEIEANRAKASE